LSSALKVDMEDKFMKHLESDGNLQHSWSHRVTGEENVPAAVEYLSEFSR